MSLQLVWAGYLPSKEDNLYACLKSIPNKLQRKHGQRVWRSMSLQLANELYENGDDGRSRVRDRDFSGVDSIWLSSPADAYFAYAEFLRRPDEWDLS